ncbi:GNAT family N-acetyltransferase [Lentibacillus lipolyticus]|nr:GNAT family N-acetyltransferase [Lentibacillus lipolyticus]
MIDIRVLKPSDAEAYRNLRLEAMLNSPEAYDSSYREVLSHSIDVYKVWFQSENAVTFGAFSENELTGMVTLVRETKSKLEHRATIQALYVTPFERGKGVGRQLMQTAINYAESLEGVDQLCLSIIIRSPKARRLYYSLGFVPSGTHKRAVKMGGRYYDEESMVMYLH